jgi:tripartite-type tricarboxylate transporter receptor subunit TctC
MQKRLFFRTVCAAALGLGLATTAAAQAWKPTKPINIVVPWAAGGSTDQITRVTAAELEKALGQKVIIVNQPGASGSIGTKNVWEAAKDGYTWAAGAAQDLGTYQALGMLEVPARDWHMFLTVANLPVVGVNASRPWKNMQELIDAMKKQPGEIKVATAGVTSGGHNAMEAISRATGVKYRHVTYDGGNPAVVATVSGETDLTTQLAVEQAEMIRAKRIRPLATVSDRPLEIEGFGTIEPISKHIPGFTAPANYFGIFIPRGVPPEVVAGVQKVWDEHIANNAAIKAYATNKGALFAPVAGDAAQKAAQPAIQANAWLLHSTGKTKVAPDQVGIPKP